MLDPAMGLASFLISGVTLGLWIRGIRRVALSGSRAPFIAAWSVGLVLAVFALAGSPGWIGGVFATLGLIGALLPLFTVAISAQKVGADAIRVGATIPHFTALDEHGQSFDSAALAGNPVLLKFFRGHW